MGANMEVQRALVDTASLALNGEVDSVEFVKMAKIAFVDAQAKKAQDESCQRVVNQADMRNPKAQAKVIKKLNKSRESKTHYHLEKDKYAKKPLAELFRKPSTTSGKGDKMKCDPVLDESDDSEADDTKPTNPKRRVKADRTAAFSRPRRGMHNK